MGTNADELELTERLKLIEDALAAGRRTTMRWGWTFVLWGVAYYVAVAWATWGEGLSVWGDGRHWPAWPVTMIGTAILTVAIRLRKGRGEPGTTVTRAISAMWTGSGVSMGILFVAMTFAGRPADQHLFVAIVAGMMGLNNGASGVILKWPAQIACGAIWWITSAAALFGSEARLAAVFVTAVFLCQIVFGIYAMTLESRQQKPGAMAHA